MKGPKLNAVNSNNIEKSVSEVIKRNRTALNINDAKDLIKIVGPHKGIQGNINSCYLDSLLTAMFSFTNVFDYLLYRRKKATDTEYYNELQAKLLNIVNILRK